ncbi:MAG: hypothetical protein ACYTF8_07765 [Planctomycetota bacterium]|jgi:hypothetical protein
MRTVAALMVLVGLGACSGSTDEEPGGWKKDALADGRLTFTMPGAAEYKQSTSGQGADAEHEEKAWCDYDNRHFSVSVIQGEALAKEMGTTERKRFSFVTFFLVGLLQQEEDRSIEDEGKWIQGNLTGKWIQVALPAKPPERTVPVYNWLYAAPWGDKAVLVQFIASQAAWDNEVYQGAVDRARERFVASVTVE